jgi:hypothetical protein
MTQREDPAMTNVFLRIEHDTAEPEALTAALGVTPTYSAKRGQLPAGGKGEPYPWNVWVLSSAYAVVSKDTRAHFQWLLASVGSRGAEMRRLREQGYRVEIHCLWVSKGGYGGPELSPEIMGGLTDLGLDIYFDVAISEQGSVPSRCSTEVAG